MTDRQPYACELFARAGEALYGDEWQSPMSRALGLKSLRTVQRIAAAARDGRPYRIEAGLMDEVRKLLHTRERECKLVWMDITKGWADN